MRFYFNESSTNKTHADSSQKEVHELTSQNEKLTQQLNEKQNELAHAAKHSHLYYEEIAILERKLESEILRNVNLIEQMSEMELDAEMTIKGPMKRLEMELDVV